MAGERTRCQWPSLSRAPDDGNNWGPAKPNAHLAYPEEMSLRPDAFPDMCYEFSSVD
jgi:hypothetical protein